jgi:hypothetical protein
MTRGMCAAAATGYRSIRLGRVVVSSRASTPEYRQPDEHTGRAP